MVHEVKHFADRVFPMARIGSCSRRLAQTPLQLLVIRRRLVSSIFIPTARLCISLRSAVSRWAKDTSSPCQDLATDQSRTNRYRS
jgi:hypothetical protein